MIHNLLFTEEDEVDYHTYSIEKLRDMKNNSIFLQVPEG
jgi:hypothetical protein